MNKNICTILSLLLCSVVLATAITGCGKENKKPDITPQNHIVAQEQVISYKEYSQKTKLGLDGLDIPSGWYLEENNNGFSVIENRTGTEITLSVSAYNPVLNNVDRDYAQNVISSKANQSFISFQKTAGNLLMFKYYLASNGTTYTVCEGQKFNYNYNYTVLYLAEEKYYEKYYSVFERVLNSIKFPQNVNTVPSGYNAIYNGNLGVLTVYPRDWQTKTGSDFYSATKASTNITVTYAATIANFSTINKTSYTSTMQQTVNNFATAAFSVNQNVVTAEGYYTQNGVRYIVYNTIYNASKYSINIVCVSPENEATTYKNIYTTMSQHVYSQIIGQNGQTNATQNGQTNTTQSNQTNTTQSGQTNTTQNGQTNTTQSNQTNATQSEQTTTTPTNGQTNANQGGQENGNTTKQPNS